MKRISAVLAASILVASCTRPPLSPPRLIGDAQTTAAIQEFLAASVDLADALGFADAGYSLSADASARSNSVRPMYFGPKREDVNYSFGLSRKPADTVRPGQRNEAKIATAVERYIDSGAHTSMIICRNYLSGLRERNDYFEFLQKEFNVAGGVATLTLGLTSANPTLLTAVAGAKDAINQALDAYQEFRYLSVEVETIIPVVEAAQIALRDYYLKGRLLEAKATSKVTHPKSEAANSVTVTTTTTVTATQPEPAIKSFAGAVYALNKIDYACSRSGIKSIINKSLIQAVPKFNVENGILVAVPADTKK